MKTVCAILSFAIVLSAALFAQEKPSSTGDEIQIQQLERAWNQAEARRDATAISSIVADSLTYIDYDGTLMNKSEYLRSVTKSNLEPDHLYDEGVSIRVFGNAAVAAGIYRETGVSKGKPYIHRARFTDTWIKQDATWQCIASQSTLILNK
jgi:ketosteroid isomerase-like protein